MKINQFFDSKLFYSLAALFFSLVLFAYVNSSKAQTGANKTTTTLTSTKSETLTTSLQLNYNSNHYFVTGYPAKVKIKLTGSTAFLTALNNTRSFTVYADLSGLKPGTHKVRLKVTGLPKGLSYRISPHKVTVTIAKKASRLFPITVNYDSSRIARGYTVQTPQLAQKYVRVTGASSTIAQISSVIAQVNIPQNATKTVTRSASLTALNDNGEAQNVVFSTSSVAVTLPISRANTTKKVAVTLVASGSGVENKKYYFSTTQKQVTVTGAASTLAKLNKISVSVPITGVSNSTKKTVAVTLPTGVTAVSPSKIPVTIKVTTSK